MRVLILFCLALPALAQTTFLTTNTAIIWGGQMTLAGNGCTQTTVVSRTATLCNTTVNITADFAVTGTQAVVSYEASTASEFTYQIDGGSVVSPTLTTGAWTNLTIFTGLTDTSHTVQIRATGTRLALETANFVTVTGASPALTTPAGFTTNGYVISSTPTAIIHEGTMQSTTTPGFGCYTGFPGFPTGNDANDASMRYTITGGTFLKLWTVQRGQLLRYSTDVATTQADNGTDIPTGSGLGYNWTTIYSGVSQPGQHDQIIYTTANVIKIVDFCTLMTDGVISTSTLAARPLDFAYGDSITIATGTVTSGTDWVHNLSVAINRPMLNLGISGSCTFDAGSQTKAGQNATHIAQIPTTVEAGWVLYGSNDMSNGTQCPGETTTQFSAAYQDMLTKIRARAPSAAIYAMDPVDRPGSSRSSYIPFIETARLALASSSIRHFYSTNWVDCSTSDCNPDHIHPNAAGDAKISAAIYALLTATESVAPSAATINASGTLTFTGTNTQYPVGGTPFLMTGGTGASLSSQNCTTATACTASLTPGSAAGTLTLLDTSSGASSLITVTFPPPVSSTNVTFRNMVVH
jgi:lysophospholipase L1-like esterase